MISCILRKCYSNIQTKKRKKNQNFSLNRSFIRDVTTIKFFEFSKLKWLKAFHKERHTYRIQNTNWKEQIVARKEEINCFSHTDSWGCSWKMKILSIFILLYWQPLILSKSLLTLWILMSRTIHATCSWNNYWYLLILLSLI